jgi:hypothetical protein
VSDGDALGVFDKRFWDLLFMDVLFTILSFSSKINRVH